MAKNVVPQLPEGVRVGAKPDNIEFFQRGRDKWFPIIESLKVIDSTMTVQIDVASASKSRVQSIKTSIRRSAKLLNFKHRIKYAVLGSTLHIWSNR